MHFDSKAAERFIATVDEVIQFTENNTEIVNSERKRELSKLRADIMREMGDVQNENRKLRIGVIGDVKAGKSSFLNALFFDGQDILPKACTPMTAALTKISYSDKPSAKVHFYQASDWNDIEERANEYDSLFEEAYTAECEKIKTQNTRQKGIIQVLTADVKDLKPKPIPSKEEFRKQFNYNVPELYLGSKELVTMAAGNADLKSKLGKTAEISGTDIRQLTLELDQYVGAHGKYTPIVNYVELCIDNEGIKDYEIIDTPGLNDPVVSRGLVTKEFLSQCDVAILLSPSTSFMPESSIAMMTDTLPNANVNNFIVVCSKADDGYLDEGNQEGILASIKVSRSSWNSHFNNTIDNLKKFDLANDNISAIAEADINYVSSIMYSIYKKKQNNQPLNESEELVISNFCDRWSDFDPSDNAFLQWISGLDGTNKSLDKIRARKNEIFEKSNETLIDNYRRNLVRIVNDIIADSARLKYQIEKFDAEEIKERYNDLNTAVDMARSRLSTVFDTAASDAKTRASSLCVRFDKEMESFNTPLKVKTQTIPKWITVDGGLFGWFKEKKLVNDIINTVDMSEGIRKITGYSTRCNQVIIDNYDSIFNFAKLEKAVKHIIIEPFAQKDSFSAEDIGLSLDRLRHELVIPPREAILLDNKKYIDTIRTKFSPKRAMAFTSPISVTSLLLPSAEDKETTTRITGNDIARFSVEITSLLVVLSDEYKKITMESADKISDSLKKQAITFADEIKSSFSEDFKKLTDSLNDKESALKKYTLFIESANALKNKLNDVEKGCG